MPRPHDPTSSLRSGRYVLTTGIAETLQEVDIETQTVDIYRQTPSREIQNEELFREFRVQSPVLGSNYSLDESEPIAVCLGIEALGGITLKAIDSITDLQGACSLECHCKHTEEANSGTSSEESVTVYFATTEEVMTTPFQPGSPSRMDPMTPSPSNHEPHYPIAPLLQKLYLVRQALQPIVDEIIGSRMLEARDRRKDYESSETRDMGISEQDLTTNVESIVSVKEQMAEETLNVTTLENDVCRSTESVEPEKISKKSEESYRLISEPKKSEEILEKSRESQIHANRLSTGTEKISRKSVDSQKDIRRLSGDSHILSKHSIDSNRDAQRLSRKSEDPERISQKSRDSQRNVHSLSIKNGYSERTSSKSIDSQNSIQESKNILEKPVDSHRNDRRLSTESGDLARMSKKSKESGMALTTASNASKHSQTLPERMSITSKSEKTSMKSCTSRDASICSKSSNKFANLAKKSTQDTIPEECKCQPDEETDKIFSEMKAAGKPIDQSCICGKTLPQKETKFSEKRSDAEPPAKKSSKTSAGPLSTSSSKDHCMQGLETSDDTGKRHSVPSTKDSSTGTSTDSSLDNLESKTNIISYLDVLRDVLADTIKMLNCTRMSERDIRKILKSPLGSHHEYSLQAKIKDLRRLKAEYKDLCQKFNSLKDHYKYDSGSIDELAYEAKYDANTGKVVTTGSVPRVDLTNVPHVKERILECLAELLKMKHFLEARTPFQSNNLTGDMQTQQEGNAV
ncbi:serine-rich adhesin for platelets-like [Periplaneta americana]|uniref:serine-rich adhesin for platelets-like n=1 Tax=Periplaneta americana TaxID=6978 RepID=UPI0037E87B75